MISGWSEGTKKQYGPHITRFIRYCPERDLDPFYASVNTVAEFLVFTFHNTTNEYSAINTARSALSSCLPSIAGMTVGKHPFIKRVMKGVFRERPSLPRYTMTFVTEVVLNYLDGLGLSGEITLPQLTERLVTLICLISGQRDQTVSFLDI